MALPFDKVIDKRKHRIKIVHDINKAIEIEKRFFENAKETIDIFIDHNGPVMIIENKSYLANLIHAKKNKTKTRFATEITKENIRYCKKIINYVSEFQHIDGFKGTIMLNGSEFIGSANVGRNHVLTPIIFSNEKEVIEQQKYIVDSFWKQGTDYTKRMAEIEEGLEPEVIETTSNSYIIQNRIFHLLNLANKEILIILSTSNAFRRQLKAGSLEKLKEIKHKKPEISIKVLTPIDTQTEKIIKYISQLCAIKFIEPLSMISVLIVDRKYCLVVELKDDTKDNSVEAIGLATYSNSHATVLSFAVIFDTLWKQIELYNQLKLTEAFKSEFLSMISHELRTPLVPIKGYTEMLLRSSKSNALNEKQKKALQTIHRNVEKEESLIEDVLNIYLFETEKLTLSKTEVVVSEIVENVINDLKPLLLDKSVTIINETETKVLDKVYCDQKRIEQVLSNLVKNSIDFVPKENGKIMISIEKRKKDKNKNKNKVVENRYADSQRSLYHLFTVKDNGPGIPEEKLDLLFKKFYKIDTSATRKYGGTGLGLAVCKDIVEAHGGRIWVDNDHLEKGTTIRFTIPIP
ncbi:MAG: ATP-binding protein [Candidatus Nitrosocosmicus sp.]